MDNTFFSLLLLWAISSSSSLPFWMTANQNGLMPESNGTLAVLKAGATKSYPNTFQVDLGMSLGANNYVNTVVSNVPRSNIMVDELYGNLCWKNLELVIGAKHRELMFETSSPDLGSLSVTGGHLVECGNARTIPGVLLSLKPIPLPIASQHIWVYGDYGDYFTTDLRYVQNALIHRTKIGIKYKGFDQRFEFDFLLDHYAVWGGDSPEFGRMDLSFDNYFRVITGSHASISGTESDQINVIGDQGGSELFKFSYSGNGWRFVAQHDIPYNDGSGMGFQNFPDGINTVCLSFDKKELLISDILFEYHYTMFQSGPINGYLVDSEGNRIEDKSLPHTGQDQYFWNGQYKSCWTHYGRIIGDPMILPSGIHLNQWSSAKMNIGTENDRYKAFHFGISGKLFRHHPYKALITYSKNFGSYNHSYIGENPAGKTWGTVKESSLNQLSCAFSGVIEDIFSVMGLNLHYGVYYDYGDLYNDALGFSLGVRYSIIKSYVN